MAELAERCEGDVGLAIELVRGGLATGRLAQGRAGLVAADEAPLPLPAAALQAWGDRLPAEGEPLWPALERAAALGPDVPSERLRRVLPGVDPDALRTLAWGSGSAPAPGTGGGGRRRRRGRWRSPTPDRGSGTTTWPARRRPRRAAKPGARACTCSRPGVCERLVAVHRGSVVIADADQVVAAIDELLAAGCRDPDLAFSAERLAENARRSGHEALLARSEALERSLRRQKR